MTHWTPESVGSSTTPQARSRTAYLHRLVPVVRERVQSYLAAQPEGVEVELACLAAVGRPELDGLRDGRALGTVKRDLGLLVTQLLVDLHGPANVQTLRRADGRASIVRNPKADLAWVYSFTPQRVVRS
jgi:hypothetical protein